MERTTLTSTGAVPAFRAIGCRELVTAASEGICTWIFESSTVAPGVVLATSAAEAAPIGPVFALASCAAGGDTAGVAPAPVALMINAAQPTLVSADISTSA